MPGIVAGNAGQRFACKCLNVRVEASLPETAPPESVVDPAYSQVYVGDEGISVKHLQLTLRSRMRVAAIPETNRCSRFTTLTCLLCDLPVYRVFQIVPADVEGKDGPILPAEDWVEKETMKSPNGWIEVHKDALVGDAIIHAEANPTHSSLFNLLIPAMSQAPVKTLPQVEDTRESTPSPEPKTFLSHVRPLFPPPPFTPSHPAFLHLASIAEKETQARREAAEKQIAELVQQKTEEIEQGDAALRQEVEALWRKFRESVKRAHGDHHHHHHHGSLSTRSPMVSRSSRSREREAQKTPFARSSSPSYGSPIAVRDFVPVSVPTRRNVSPPPRPSALSASLATTTFHHPRARQASPGGGDSPDSGSSRTLSTRSGSETLVQPTNTNGVNVLQFRRNINDTINTQASYRYFLNLEEEMARDKKRREELAKAKAQTSTDAQEASSTTQATPKANGKQKNGSPGIAKPEVQPPKEGDKPSTEEPTSPSRGRDPKGKRKVTFDDVVTISETSAELATQANSADQHDTKDMIFDMEDTEREDKNSSPQLAPALPFLEQPTAQRPLRPAKAKPKTNGLSQSFAGLRPASLPNPSYLRPRSQPGVDSSHVMRLSLPRGPNSLNGRGSKVNGSKSPTGEEDKEGTNDEETRLVGADMPSHRGAWSIDGRTWQDFTRSHNIASNVIAEENEVDNDEVETGACSSAKNAPNGSGQGSNEQQVPRQGRKREKDIEINDQDETSYDASAFGVPGSLPVHIQLRTKPREVLSLASYAQQHAMPQEQQPQPAGTEGHHHKPMSTATIRRAMYDERDRARSIDPGPLDFATVEEEGEDEESETEESETEEEKAQMQAFLSTSRARKRALKILQAAQQLPEAGMWRSLAS